MLKYGLLLLIVPPLLLMGGYLYEQAAVDACVDQGGSWNYLQASCDLAQSHPFVPFLQRHPLLVNGGMLLALVGFFLCLGGLYRGAARR